MGSLIIALVVLGCSFGGSLLGMYLRQKLPELHLDSDSRDVVKLVMGLVATMAALVLGLLVASANASHERQTEELRELSADIILLDRTLALYGPDARTLRDGVRDVARQTHDAVWSPDGVRPENLNSATVQSSARAILGQVAALQPKTDMQRMLQAHAFDQLDSVSKARLQMFESRGGQIAWPFLAVLIFWISILFLGFGLLAPFNATLAVTQFLGALSVAGALFMILELNEPYGGLLRISDAPLSAAIAQLDRP
ncbi:MAG TPA: hypothetical protein VHY34_06910 [Caulobacteraceae bacterium]|jgi:hypothetical protein|nr:hypothetical protein [Caulobacteraceae bacterium]